LDILSDFADGNQKLVQNEVFQLLSIAYQLQQQLVSEY